MNRLTLLLLGACFGLSAPSLADGADGVVGTPIELKAGDRVVLIGSTLIEREAESGYLETRIARSHPGQAIVVRNLGWSGDTVAGITRGKPNPPTDGFAKLVEHVAALKPTVIVLGYGGNESFGGAAGLPAFRLGLGRLWDALEPTGAKFIVLTPTRQAGLGAPLPDPTAHNADLELYGDVLRAEAVRRGAAAVDLFATLPMDAGVTANGIHLNPTGYWVVSGLIAPALRAAPSRPLGVTVAAGKATATAATIGDPAPTPTGWKLQVRADFLPEPPLPPRPQARAAARFDPPVRTCRVANLPPGSYALSIDKVAVGRGDQDQWAAGVALASDPDEVQVEQLRQAIVRKNLLHFHRWRPQNETYLFGFRKHEQGQNAAELAAFDPLIAAAEAEIVRLSRPVSRTYELSRVADSPEVKP